MTRLTESDVRGLTAALEAFERDLSAVSGLTLRDVATRSVADDPICVPLFGARIAAVPISTGEGFIPGFCDCVAAILGHLGCEAWVTDEPDVRGIQAAADEGAQVLFLADDHRFIALDLHNGRLHRRRPRHCRRLRGRPGGRGERSRGQATSFCWGSAPLASPRRAVSSPSARRSTSSSPTASVCAPCSAPACPCGPSRSTRAWPSATSSSTPRRPRRPHRRRSRDGRDDRGRARHALGLHRGGAAGAGRAPHPRAARRRRDGDGGARPLLTG